MRGLPTISREPEIRPETAIGTGIMSMGETTAEGDGDACSKALADCSASREVRLTAAELLPPFLPAGQGNM